MPWTSDEHFNFAVSRCCLLHLQTCPACASGTRRTGLVRFISSTDRGGNVPEPQLTADERTRAADLFEAHGEEVVARLMRSNPFVDPEMLHDAFVMALLEIAKSPEKFDSQRGTPIASFLCGAAQQYLGTLRRSDTRRQLRDRKKGETLVAERQSAARSVLDTAADAEDAELIRQQVAQTEEERQVLRLWELGCGDAEIAEQLKMDLSSARHVRDRVIQRLRRLVEKKAESER
jgi:hypothetical protein